MPSEPLEDRRPLGAAENPTSPPRRHGIHALVSLLVLLAAGVTLAALLTEIRTERQTHVEIPDWRDSRAFSIVPLAPQAPSPFAAAAVDDIDDLLLDLLDGAPDRSAPASIGVGGRAASAYGEWFSKGALIREGGSEKTEDAVRAALDWLRRHQHTDGGWRARDFTEMCKATCTHINPQRRYDRSVADHDIAVTGLAMLAFIGYGHTHRDGLYPEYVDVLGKAVRYLRLVQLRSDDPTTHGRFGARDHGHWIDDHAIATLAMSELLIRSNDIQSCKRPVTAAAKLCLRARHESFRGGSSASGWMLLALMITQSAGLDLPNAAFDDALSSVLRRLYRAARSHRHRSLSNERVAATSSLYRMLAGGRRKDAWVLSAMDLLAHSPPTTDDESTPAGSYDYWYFGSHAMFQFGGSEWRAWNDHLQTTLLGTQRRGNTDEDGSWDPIGESGVEGSRVYSTAVAAMTLQVYYHFPRAAENEGFIVPRRSDAY